MARQEKLEDDQEQANCLADFLESEQDEGQFVSAGQFQIDWNRAHLKRKNFTFEHSYQWICRCLQVLVKSECRALDVHYGRQSFHLHAKLGKPLPAPKLLLEPDQVMGQQVMEFIWGAQSKNLSVELDWQDPDKHTWSLKSVDEGTQIEDLGADSSAYEFSLKVETKSFKDKLAGLVWGGLFAGEYRELIMARRLLPFPLTVDSRFFSPVEPHRDFPLWYARWGESGDGGTGFSIPRCYLNPWVEECEPSACLSSPKKVEYLILMRYRIKPREIRYHWVIDGLPVPMETGPLTGWPTATSSCCWTDVYISAGGLKTDLTGFKVISGKPQASELINQALERLAENPPVRFVHQLSETVEQLSALSSLRTVLGQFQNLVRKPVMAKVQSAHRRSAHCGTWQKVLEEALREYKGHNPPSEFWENLCPSRASSAGCSNVTANQL